MRRYLRSFAAALVMLAAIAAPARAADEKTTVKVALLDMSSHMSAGMMQYGMMGPGMMGPGMMSPGMMSPGMMSPGMMSPGMMGPGMMGPGMMGQGQGSPYPGMTGQGMMGPGMMGSGMMGMMMNGMMSIRVDKSTVKAGTVTFDVTNWSRSVLHEVLVISVDNPSAPLPYDYAQARVPEEQVKVLGEAGDLEPNASKTLELTLAPGSYLLVCNVPGHYAAGMVASLNVAP
jgi:uncharacterized cupredoxin-like copper-binding protein